MSLQSMGLLPETPNSTQNPKYDQSKWLGRFYAKTSEQGFNWHKPFLYLFYALFFIADPALMVAGAASLSGLDTIPDHGMFNAFVLVPALLVKYLFNYFAIESIERSVMIKSN